jgi:hypothetical protein
VHPAYQPLNRDPININKVQDHADLNLYPFRNTDEVRLTDFFIRNDIPAKATEELIKLLLDESFSISIAVSRIKTKKKMVEMCQAMEEFKANVHHLILTVFSLAGPLLLLKI